MSWTLTETMYVECLANTWCLGEDAGSEHGTFFFYLYIKTHKVIKQQTKNPWSTFAVKLDDQIFYILQILARKDKPPQRQDQGAWAQHLCRRKQRGQRGAPVIRLGTATTQEGLPTPGLGECKGGSWWESGDWTLHCLKLSSRTGLPFPESTLHWGDTAGM